MIENIRIRNFRGIRDCSLSGMKQINLFLGRNNCGKSSVLDALFLFSGATNPRLPLTINWARNYMNQSPESLKMNFYGLNAESVISLSGQYKATRRDVEISYKETFSPTLSMPTAKDIHPKDEKIYSLNLKTRITPIADSSQIKEYDTSIQLEKVIGKTAQVKDADSSYKEELSCRYITANEPNSNSLKQFATLLEDKQENFVFDMLRKVEPRLKDIVSTDDGLLADVGMEKRIPIQFLGDGIRRLLSVVLHIHESKNGILLIDEVDNGLHYSAMSVLWETILETAVQTGTQVFVTTHSLESLKGLASVLDANGSKYQDMVSVFKLIKRPTDELIGLKYDYEQFDYSIKQEMEMR